MTTNKTLGEVLDDVIKSHVYEMFDELKRGVPLPEVDYWTDNLGQIVEKLAILHARTWNLEDMKCSTNDVQERDAIDRKLTICWKKHRPALVSAINRMVDDAIVHHKSLREESLKIYKGIDPLSNFPPEDFPSRDQNGLVNERSL